MAPQLPSIWHPLECPGGSFLSFKTCLFFSRSLFFSTNGWLIADVYCIYSSHLCIYIYIYYTCIRTYSKRHQVAHLHGTTWFLQTLFLRALRGPDGPRSYHFEEMRDDEARHTHGHGETWQQKTATEKEKRSNPPNSRFHKCHSGVTDFLWKELTFFLTCFFCWMFGACY